MGPEVASRPLIVVALRKRANAAQPAVAQSKRGARTQGRISDSRKREEIGTEPENERFGRGKGQCWRLL
jgi:hypothetical protein